SDRVQLGNAAGLDQDFWRDDAAADIDDEIGPAAKEARLRMRRARCNKRVLRFRPHDFEIRQCVHYEIPLPLALPSRPCFSNAAKTRSGVTGRLLNRRPVASAMALVSAAPVSKTMEPSKSSLSLTVACGSPVQFTGLEAPLM